MDQFAKQDYYDTIIAAITAKGGRLLSQVQTNTPDFQYHVEVTDARDTALVFDLPGKALFLILHHNEHVGFMDRGYENHWYIRVDCEYNGISKLIDQLIGTYTGSLESLISDRMSAFGKISGTTGGWCSGNDQQRTFNADVNNTLGTVLAVPAVITAVALEVLSYQSNHDYLAENFTELMPMWWPYYSFKVMVNGYSSPVQQKALENYFWTKFAENSKTPSVNEIMRNKIKRVY